MIKHKNPSHFASHKRKVAGVFQIMPLFNLNICPCSVGLTTCSALYIIKLWEGNWVINTECNTQSCCVKCSNNFGKLGQNWKNKIFFGYDRTWTCISWSAVAGIEPAPLDLEMPSALLRASQPGTLPLSYVAGVQIGTMFQNYAPWHCMFSTHVEIGWFHDQVWQIKTRFLSKKNVLSSHQVIILLTQLVSSQKTTFFLSDHEEPRRQIYKSSIMSNSPSQVTNTRSQIPNSQIHDEGKRYDDEVVGA